MKKEIYKKCPLCKKENHCYKIGTKVFCEKATKILKKAEHGFNLALSK